MLGKVRIEGDSNCSFPPILEIHGHLVVSLPWGSVEHYLGRGIVQGRTLHPLSWCDLLLVFNAGACGLRVCVCVCVCVCVLVAWSCLRENSSSPFLVPPSPCF